MSNIIFNLVENSILIQESYMNINYYILNHQIIRKMYLKKDENENENENENKFIDYKINENENENENEIEIIKDLNLLYIDDLYSSVDEYKSFIDDLYSFINKHPFIDGYFTIDNDDLIITLKN